MHWEQRLVWKSIKEHKPEDDKCYLVSWLDASGEYSMPHRAYYLEPDEKFFSLETYNAFPLHVDIFMEIPEVPKAE